MPQWLLSCYVQMLPRLQAEESLRQVSVLQAASPYAKQQTRARAISKWQQIVGGEEARVNRVSDMTPAQERLAFAQMGFAMQTVSPKPN